MLLHSIRLHYRKLYLCVLLASLLSSCHSHISPPPRSHSPLPPSLPAVPSQKPPQKPKPIILIDAGHGGHDHGTYSQDKRVKEKNLNLTTAMLLRKQLQAMGYRPMITRQRDSFLTLQQRVNKANQLGVDLFVSIHYNSAPNKQAEGIEVFYHNNSKSRHGQQRMQKSQRLAQEVIASVAKQTHCQIRGIKEGNFYVIRHTAMPAILVEGGFLTNAKEMAKLRNQRYLQQIACGIAIGIERYVQNKER